MFKKEDLEKWAEKYADVSCELNVLIDEMQREKTYGIRNERMEELTYEVKKCEIIIVDISMHLLGYTEIDNDGVFRYVKK